MTRIYWLVEDDKKLLEGWILQKYIGWLEMTRNFLKVGADRKLFILLKLQECTVGEKLKTNERLE